MASIKKREIIKGTIKTINKGVILSQKTKDNMVNIKDKSENFINTDENNANEYAINKIAISSKIGIDNSSKIKQRGNQAVKDTKDNFIKTKSKIKNIKNKLAEKKELKATKKGIKTSSYMAKKEVKKTTKETMKASQKAIKFARETAKKTYQGTKKVIKTTISVIKGIIAATKALITALVAFGCVAIVAILVICLVGLLCSSMFGIFFSSEDLGNNIKMSDCIKELNSEMDSKIKSIEDINPHDEVVINSNKALWKEILSVYSVKVSGGNNEKDVITIDDDKKKVLKEVFWDMNEITYEVVTEEYESNSIGTLINTDLTFNNNTPSLSNNIDNDNTNEENVLYIYIKSKSVNEIKNKYSFNEVQLKQLDELTSDKYLSLWSSVIYGIYGSSGEISDWKQKGKEWSDIKVGTTNSTLGEIGCLITSVAILIEKSNVDTNNISPFNPGTFLIALNNNYGFDSDGNLQYSAISKAIPDFEYQGLINLNGKSKSEKLYELKKYYEDGYYISAEVYGATPNNQHWVAIDNITNNDIIMLDPASNSTNMWDKYDWNKTSQFIYFKVKG